MFWQMPRIWYDFEFEEVDVFLFTQGSYLGTLSPRWENYLIWKVFWQLWICLHQKCQRTYMSSMGWPSSIDVYQKLCFHYGPHHKALTQNKGVWVDWQLLRSVGGHKVTVFGCTNFSCTQMGHGVSRPHRCVKFGNWDYASSKSYWKMWSTNCIRLETLKQCKEKLHHHQKKNTCHGLCFA